MTGFRLSDDERRQYEEQGFVVREGIFDAGEVREIIDECERMVADLVRVRKGQRMKFGSYTFDADFDHDTVIKWEGDSDVVHGIEPFVHLSPKLHDWALDPRMTDPMSDVLGCDAPELFTEKLNLKRPKYGGVNPMHQDYPYWVQVAEVAEEVATIMLFLDDSTLENGCLRVVPGSHKSGQWKTRTDGDRFAANEIDVAAYPEAEALPVELTAGSLIMFGSFLVHQSAPNNSDKERRALLYSYQPPGRRTQIEAFRDGWKRRAGIN